MKITPFRLERYFARYEFNTRYLLCSSDCESLPVQDLLGMEPGAEEGLQRLRLGYTEPAGDPALRREIAGLYQGLGAENILVHAGAEESVFLFFHAALNPGDHIIVHWPCYQSLYELAKEIGCEITSWIGNAEDHWQLDPDFVRANLRSNTRAVVINCPHNPSGYLMDRSGWSELNRLSQQHGFIVFSDEVYRYLEYHEEDRLPSFCEINDRAVSLNVLSKSFGLAGLRIGWIATRNQELLRQIAAWKDYTTICNSAPSEYLGTLAVRHRDKIISRNRAIIARNLTLADDFFARYRERFDWLRPTAGPIAFPRLRDGENASDFCQRLVEQAGVLLLPGSQYDDAYQSHFRIGFGRENMPAALDRLEEFLQGEAL